MRVHEADKHEQRATIGTGGGVALGRRIERGTVASDRWRERTRLC